MFHTLCTVCGEGGGGELFLHSHLCVICSFTLGICIDSVCYIQLSFKCPCKSSQDGCRHLAWLCFIPALS